MTTQTTSRDASMIAPRAEPETKIRPRSALLRRPAEDEAVHLAVDERRARGQAQRTKTPRSSQSYWAESPDRPDPIALLESQAATRLPDLVPIRYARMRLSPFAFLRGSAIVMAHDLARTPQTGIQTQLCGDGHCSNFGVFASPERTLLFDLNDLDETYPGPWEWDVKRLAASIYVAGRHNGFAEADCRRAVSATARPGWSSPSRCRPCPRSRPVAKVNAPLALTLRSSPPLSCSTTVPDSPETVPPTEYVAAAFAVQVTATLVTFADPMVPDPLATEQVCPDGFVFTVTL